MDTVLVTGGTGTLGQAVVQELGRRGVGARVMSRSAPAGPLVARGDLVTGEGLDEAVTGAAAVIHCASDPRHASATDVEGTRRLLSAVARRSPSAHLVYISIVGADLNPFAYYRAKTRGEEVVRAATTPASVVRATQFHPLVATLSRLPPRGPVALTFAGMRFQPCDTAFVAERLVDVALSGRPTGSLEVAGPEVLSVRRAIRLTSTHDGRTEPLMLTVPALGGTLQAFARGTNLPGRSALTGGRGYAAWLAGEPAGTEPNDQDGVTV